MKNYLNNVCLQKILLKVNYLFLSFVYKKSIRRNQMHTALKIIFWYSLFLTIYSASNATSILYFRKWDFLPLHFNIFQWYCTSSQSLAFYPDPVEFCIKSKKKNHNCFATLLWHFEKQVSSFGFLYLKDYIWNIV